MEGLCKDCAFWYRFTQSEMVGTCEEVGYLKNEDSKERTDNAFVFVINAPDDQGLDYSLQTGPKFGCLKFKPKEIK